MRRTTAAIAVVLALCGFGIGVGVGAWIGSPTTTITKSVPYGWNFHSTSSQTGGDPIP